jgi:hypothetical protein
MNDFINRYRIKHIRVNRDYETFNYGYNQTASYYNNREEIVEMELPRGAFEELAALDRKFDDMAMEYRDEAYMRRQYPALREAYDKYRMLLELYR